MGKAPRGQPGTSHQGGYAAFPGPLLERAIGGDPRAAERLWEWLAGFCHHTASAICRRQGMQPDLVDDVVQNAVAGLLGLPHPLRHLRQLDDPLAYLYTVVRNSVRTQWRRILRRRDRENVSLDQLRDRDDDRPWTLAELFADGSDPVAHAEVAELQERLDQELAKFPKERARVFRLHVRGLTHKEIAEAARVPIGTVGTWIFRIRKHLRRAWDLDDAL